MVQHEGDIVVPTYKMIVDFAENAIFRIIWRFWKTKTPEAIDENQNEKDWKGL